MMFDSVCSIASSLLKKDFIRIGKTNDKRQLNGISEGRMISGEGIIKYTVSEDDGIDIDTREKFYYLPDIQYLLLPPQGIFHVESNPVEFWVYTTFQASKAYARLKVIPMEKV